VDISELLGDAERRGFTHNFAVDQERLRCSESGECFGRDDATIVWSEAVDMGTDPGDDATIYLIETTSGRKGFVLVADAFHADPQKAAFIDSLPRRAAGADL
jgi:hypothetical protein